MGKRFVCVVLIALLLILHAQLWLGRGSVTSVARLVSQIDAQKRNNARAALTNARLAAEISDLREGMEIVEERARAELGMVRPNEIYVQIAR
ncbi:MAG: septum formation initiator family protein [Rhodoferax sp.]|nr:septum formation initiator family protein [Rhodoferax sp.]